MAEKKLSEMLVPLQLISKKENESNRILLKQHLDDLFKEGLDSVRVRILDRTVYDGSAGKDLLRQSLASLGYSTEIQQNIAVTDIHCYAIIRRS